MTASALLSLLITGFCVALNLLFSGYLAALWDSPQLANLFLVYNIGFVVSGVLNLFNYLEQANLSFKGIFLTGLVRQVFFFLFVGITYWLDYPVRLIELVWVQVFSVLAATLLAYFFVRSKLRFSRSISRAWVGSLFGYGKYAFGTFISSMLSSTLDQMMLGAMLSPAASGAYNIAVRVVNLVDVPTNAMAVIVFPQSAKRMAEEGKTAIKYLYEKSVGITLAILVPMVLFLYFFAEWIIEIIAGGRYADSIPLLKITLLYCVFNPFGRQTRHYSRLDGKNQACLFSGSDKYAHQSGSEFHIYQTLRRDGGGLRHADLQPRGFHHRPDRAAKGDFGQLAQRVYIHVSFLSRVL